MEQGAIDYQDAVDAEVTRPKCDECRAAVCSENSKLGECNRYQPTLIYDERDLSELDQSVKQTCVQIKP